MIVAGTVDGTPVVVIVKAGETVCPAATVTVAGTIAAALSLESATCAPPVGATALNVTRFDVAETPPATLAGDSVNVVIVSGFTTSVSVFDTPLYVAVIVTVVAVQDISSENFVERDLMLIKVNATAAQRTEIALLVEMFRGRVVDISAADMMMEISGQESKIEAFIELMRPYGIIELARTGRIALVRGNAGHGGEST